MLWLLLLPFRLFFGVVFGLLALPIVLLLLPVALLLWIPFLILRFTLKIAVMAVVLPIVAIAAVLAIFAAVLVPLVPLALVGLGIWLVVRLTRHSPAATAIRG